MNRMLPSLATLASTLLALATVAGAQERPLQVVQSGPEGEVESRPEANEIRVLFSEPMVVLGRIPQSVTAPFFRISPRITGSFRWSGTNTLIFTPEDPEKLPYATRFQVTVDGATSVAGKRLAQPHTFAFTTPTVKLLRTEWYRRLDRYDQPVVLLLRFNQPVSVEGVAPHLRFRYEPHEWTAPVPEPAALERMRAADPASVDDFRAKVQKTEEAVRLSGVVAARPTTDWNKATHPPARDLLVLETAEVPPTDAWIRVELGPDAKGVEGPATPGRVQSYTVKLEPTLFVAGFRCAKACDPDSYNPLRLRGQVTLASLRGVTTASDVTDPLEPATLQKTRRTTEADEEAVREDYEYAYDRSSSFTLDDVGFTLRPARTYAITVGRALGATDGQTLGYTWAGLVESWHQTAFTSFGTGHGVWESSGGSRLPFSARNLRTVEQWLAPLSVDELTPRIVDLQKRSFWDHPEAPAVTRRLSPTPDRVQAVGIDLKPVLSPAGTGLAWAALQEGQPIPKAHHDPNPRSRSSVVQVTNLGLSVKDSPQNTLVLVTRLSDAAPVEGARVSIRKLDNTVFWSGLTDKDGLALAPRTALRDPERTWELAFVVTAEKDGDVAYVGSDWNDGVEPWYFGHHLDLHEAQPLLRGAVFADRGVYRLGEEVHLKAVLRSDTPEGVRLIEKGTAVEIVTTDSQANELDKRTVALNEWSSAEWTFEVPEGAPLGTYQVQATIGGQRSAAIGSFLVAAYRRPDFRVDVNLAGEAPVAGVKLKGVVTARYLFGAPMAGREVRWTYSRLPLDTPPAAVIRRPESEKFVLVDEERDDRWMRRAPESLQQRPGVLDAQGQRELDLDTDLVAGRPYEYTLEGDVTDLSRQTIAGRASFRVEPAPWYVGLRRPSYFADVARGVDTDVVAVGLDGAAVVGVPVKVTLTQVQWHAVRRAEGHGFYTWESERKEVAVDAWDVTTTAEPAPLHVPIQTGGYFVLRATAKEADGRWTTSATSFYVLGPGYTAWERHDHNRIDLVPEKKRYRPGDTARIMIKSPWEKAHVLLTTEREGVRTWRTFDLASTQETVSVPITESDIPNLYVSVMLVKGRSGGFDAKDSGDPGKPAFRVGYVELEVDDGSKHLDVAVKSDKEEYRPASTAQVEVQVKDTQGKGVAAEVTLWAVDYGVLSLTGYRTPDVRGRVWVEKALQVMTGDSRQNIVSRRVIVPKGGEEGGGGGGDDGSGEPVRRDFRVLAFWLGSLTTDASGRARTDVLLPESLTTYRIMAVAADKASRFGSDDREVRISKPVLLKPAFPRFLARGDVAEFGAVVHSQLKEKGTAIVTMRSLDPALLEVTGDARKTVTLPARGAAEVRFGVRAKAVGRPRLQVTVRLQGEADAFEDAVPVEILASPEVVAAYGQANPEAKETVELPEGVVPGFGGLHVETSSTALVGLGEGARYLVDYPYGCAEQRASAALALALASDLGEAFRLPGVEPAKLREIAQGTFKELEEYQCESGGFAFWKGNCRTVSPYVTSYVLHVLQRGKALSYSVTPSVLENGYGYLERELGGERPTNEGWWPAYTAWQAFAIKVLAEGGRPQDSHATRLFGFIDRMPVFGMAYLRDAMLVSGDKTPRPAELERRMRNAILPEGGSAHVEELSDPYLLYFWNSSVRSTALALDSFVRHGGPEELIPRMVRWLMQVRKKGRWGNTQENATAMEALVAYYKKYESEVPEFRGTVALGGETLATPVFRGRSTRAQVADVPMRRLAEKAKPGERLDLTFKKEGTGTMFYVAQLKYAVDAILQDAMDQGFRVERSYAADSGGAPATTFTAGDLVKVTLTLRLTKERRFVAVTDPLPAGLEPVEAWFATTASSLAREQRDQEDGGDWMSWWQGGGFDRVERHDDRVLLFATRLSEGEHVFSYVARATTSGTFRTAPAHAEEMYEPEVFGRTPTAVVTVTPIPQP